MADVLFALIVILFDFERKRSTTQGTSLGVCVRKLFAKCAKKSWVKDVGWSLLEILGIIAVIGNTYVNYANRQDALADAGEDEVGEAEINATLIENGQIDEAVLSEGEEVPPPSTGVADADDAQVATETRIDINADVLVN